MHSIINDVAHWNKQAAINKSKKWEIFNLTVKISDGIGVILSTWIKLNKSGKCPSWDPVRNTLADVNRIPLTPPKVDKATKIGTSQCRLPNILAPKETATAGEEMISSPVRTAK